MSRTHARTYTHNIYIICICMYMCRFYDLLYTLIEFHTCTYVCIYKYVATYISFRKHQVCISGTPVLKNL